LNVSEVSEVSLFIEVDGLVLPVNPLLTGSKSKFRNFFQILPETLNLDFEKNKSGEAVLFSLFARMSIPTQSRRWTGTQFFGTVSKDLFLEKATARAGMDNEPRPEFVHRPHITWICVGIETCPTTGREHAQFAFETNKKCMASTAKALFFRDTHIEASRATAETNRNYCFKTRPGDVPNTETYEVGSPMRPGARTDLEALGERIIAGEKPEEIAQTNPGAYIRYSKGLQALRAVVVDYPRDDSTPKKVIVHYGPTGTGKTRTAIANAKRDFGPGNYYLKSAGMGEWWDGYDGHKCVIIDEFRSSFKPDYFLGLLDRNEFRVQVKGGSRQFVADTIYITSATHPDEWYPNVGTDIVKAQINRRITEIIFMDTTTTLAD
jgi:hypothetical protein